jgi:hypothetical protein
MYTNDPIKDEIAVQFKKKLKRSERQLIAPNNKLKGQLPDRNSYINTLTQEPAAIRRRATYDRRSCRTTHAEV